jgi:NADH:ubiquinone oxidoreductase subunit F (NADH-binding)
MVKGKKGDLEELQHLGETISRLSLCGLGQTAPIPVLSTIRYFREEYESIFRDHSARPRYVTDLFIL